MKKKTLIITIGLLFATFFAQAQSEKDLYKSFVKIPGKDYAMMKTEVTQELYKSVMMGNNPSAFNGDNLPVECVSWHDAICFCNLLSEKYGMEPAYSVNGTTNVRDWDYIPHEEYGFPGKLKKRWGANGFRLPTTEEWKYAARGGQDYIYSRNYDIDNLEEEGWYDDSGYQTHPVAQKEANGYGLYGMNGNVREWVFDTDFIKYMRRNDFGFRIICPSINF